MAVQRAHTKTEQIIKALRERIDRQDYEVGEPIPSTAKLEEEFGASKTAVTSAVKELKQEGLLEGKPGKGVYVTATSSELQRTQADLGTLEEGLKAAREEIEQLRTRSTNDEGLQREIENLRNLVINLYGYVMELYSRIGARQPEGLRNLSQDFNNEQQRDAS